MIGAVIFVIFFLLFLVVTLSFPTLPPGRMFHGLLGIPETTYPVPGISAWLLINAIVNGIFYGFIVWLIFTVVRAVTKSKVEREEYRSGGLEFYI